MSSIYQHDLMFGGQIKRVIFDHTAYDKFKNSKKIMTTTMFKLSINLDCIIFLNLRLENHR